MIITQFRKFTPINITLLIGMGVLLCVSALRNLPEQIDAVLVSPALYLLFEKLQTVNLSPQLNIFLTLVITVIQALYINRVLSGHNFFSRPNFLVALMYLTLASLTLPFLVLSPILLCNFLFIWILAKLLRIYNQQTILRDMFDLGVIVAVGSLLYLPFISMLIGIWSGLRLFRPLNWREWVVPLMGLLSVYLILWVLYFWNGKEKALLRLWTSVSNPPSVPAPNDVYDYMILMPILLIVILFLITLQQTIFKRIVYIRKTVQLIFILLLISLAAYFLRIESMHNVEHFLLVVPPLSIYMAYYFNYASPKWLFESVYILLVAVILFFHIL